MSRCGTCLGGSARPIKKPCTPANRIVLTSHAAGWRCERQADRSAAAGVHRRDLGQDQHGAAARLVPAGRAAVAKVPHGHWKTHDVPRRACARPHRRALRLDGPINGESFRAYVEQVLVPTLQAGRHRHHGQPRRHKGGPSARRSAQPAPACCSCRRTLPTSTRSSRSSPSSRRCCAKPGRAHQRGPHGGHRNALAPFTATNAPTTSPTQAMLR